MISPQTDNQKYIKELKDQKLTIEIEQLKKSIIININNFKEIIDTHFSSEFSLEQIVNKNESLSSFKSINKVFIFFSKLIDKNKFKIEEKNNYYILKFYYEDKLEDIEIEFDVKKKELNINEGNKILENSLNKLSEKFKALQNEIENLKNFKNNFLNLCWPVGSYYWTNKNI